jgi:hypothetical protein
VHDFRVAMLAWAIEHYDPQFMIAFEKAQTTRKVVITGPNCWNFSLYR